MHRFRFVVNSFALLFSFAYSLLLFDVVVPGANNTRPIHGDDSTQFDL